MTRNKMLMAAAASALALSVVGVPSVLAQTSGPGNSGAAPGNSQGNGPGNGRGCPYPSTRTPNMTESASPSSVRRGGSSTVSGKMNGNGCGIGGKPVGLYGRTGTSGDFRLLATTKTGSDGSFTFPAQKPTQTTSYKTMFAGDPSHDAAASNVVTVTVTGK